MLAIRSSFFILLFFTLGSRFNTMSEEPYTLDEIRSTLIRLEDTIIFGMFSRDRVLFTLFLTCSSALALIERAQFALNPCAYERGALEFKGATGDRSFLQFFLWETEKVHGKCLLSIIFNPHIKNLFFII